MRTFNLSDAERLERLRDAYRYCRVAREALNELELALASTAEARLAAAAEYDLAKAHTAVTGLLADAEVRAITTREER